MKKEIFFSDYGKVVVRTPLYHYLNLFDTENNTKELECVVMQMVECPTFLEGIYWSSPQLFDTVSALKKEGANVLRKNKVMQALKKYVIRAATRCTPYGIYAGCSVTEIGTTQTPTIQNSERKVRIDLGLLQQMIQQIELELWFNLRYQVNNSLYHLPGHYRFVESVFEDGRCQYQVSSLEKTDVLEQIIASTKNKVCIEIHEVFGLIGPDVDEGEAKEFVKELIDTQFLVSELRPGLTNENELERIAEILKRLVTKGISAAIKYVDLFTAISAVLIECNSRPVGDLPVKQIKKLTETFDHLGISTTNNHVFHTDLKQAVPKNFHLSNGHLQELNKAIIALGKITPNQSQHEAQIRQFKKMFLEKYETKEIPLAEALDPEFGIGFPALDSIGNIANNPLTEKLDFITKKNKSAGKEKCHFWLQDKMEALGIQIFEKGIQLTDEDLAEFDDKTDQLANNFAVVGTMLPKGKILLQSVGGGQANMLLGRFAYLDESLGNLCKTIANKEADTNEDIVFAEIIHIPDGRSGNIARRLPFAKYEIPFLASASLGVQQQLSIKDIVVSVQNDEIVLRSKRLNKRIIPRLSNAHNYNNSSLPIYKFLGTIQHQGKPGFEINWGSDANAKRFLPRVYYENIILSPACWMIQKSDLQKINKSKNPLDELKEFFVKWHVPRFVCFSEGDNELFIDTANESYLHVLLKEIKACNKARLVEWLHNDGIAEESEIQEQKICQFILPVSNIRPKQIRPAEQLGEGFKLKRSFEPGSEWVYFKIYCGAFLSDTILHNIVKPAIDFFLKGGLIQKAFFIRYTDPHYHIRLRFHLADNQGEDQFAIVTRYIQNLIAPYLADRTVWKLQLDTYQREVERYGEGSILESETVFFHDSLLFLNCLENELFVGDEQIRFFAALKNLDAWLTLFKMQLQDKINFCAAMSNAFEKEFDDKLRPQIDLEYRQLKKALIIFLNEDAYNCEFEKRAEKLNSLQLLKDNLPSYIHMSFNRWFTTEQRLMEYMAYLFCGKYYKQLVHQ